MTRVVVGEAGFGQVTKNMVVSVDVGVGYRGGCRNAVADSEAIENEKMLRRDRGALHVGTVSLAAHGDPALAAMACPKARGNVRPAVEPAGVRL